MLRILVRVLAVLAVLACTIFLIPSSIPFAGAENAIFDYEPVVLAASSVEPLEMGEIGVGGRESGKGAGLLEGDDIPLFVTDYALQIDLLGVGADTTHHLTVFVVGLARQQVVVMAVDGASTNIGIANDE